MAMKKLQLAFAHLNLRWNPFGEASMEDIARLAIVQVEQYVDRLRRPGFALQFMGAPGRGKTTHMLALREYFPQAPYFHFAEGAAIPEIPEAPLLFLDETQRLPRALRKRVFSRQASFVIGTHLNHSRELKKAGKECTVIQLKGISVERLDRIIRRRIEWARRCPGPVPAVSLPEVERLIRTYHDDLSGIFSALYEKFQAMEERTDVEEPADDIFRP